MRQIIQITGTGISVLIGVILMISPWMLTIGLFNKFLILLILQSFYLSLFDWTGGGIYVKVSVVFK